MESNIVHNDFKNVSNEKQNSLASEIRIGLDGELSVLKFTGKVKKDDVRLFKGLVNGLFYRLNV